MLIVAHRACPIHGPENSLSGIQRAAELGADVVEIDVRRSLLGEPVLMHDSLLWRTTRVPFPVRWTPASVNRRLRLVGSGGSATVPTLAEALDALPVGLGVALDVKDPGAGAATLAVVRASGAASRVRLWSQHEEVVRSAARSAPELEVSLLRDTSSDAALDRLADDAVAWGARGVSIHESAVRSDVIDRFRRRGLLVYSWLQDEAALSRLSTDATDLDGVVTDWPQAARRLFG